jgi:hypothetical protein
VIVDTIAECDIRPAISTGGDSRRDEHPDYSEDIALAFV